MDCGVIAIIKMYIRGIKEKQNVAQKRKKKKKKKTASKINILAYQYLMRPDLAFVFTSRAISEQYTRGFFLFFFIFLNLNLIFFFLGCLFCTGQYYTHFCP